MWKRKIYKNKKIIIMRVPWLSMPLLIMFFFIFFIFHFPVFLCCAMRMRKKKKFFRCAQREEAPLLGRPTTTSTHLTDLMTYVLCFVLFFLHTGNTGLSQRLMVLTDEELDHADRISVLAAHLNFHFLLKFRKKKEPPMTR